MDNSSDHATAAALEGIMISDPRVVYIDSRSNIGFARGCNWGASLLTDQDYVAFVNPDVFLSQRLGRLREVLISSNACIAAGRLTGVSDHVPTNARKRVTAGRELIRACTGDRPYVARDTDDGYTKVGHLAGALMVLSRQDFVALGRFDERFELYYEDVDLSLRAEALGGCVQANCDFGVHIGGASYKQASQRSFCVLRVSRVRWFRKWYGPRIGSAMALLVAIADATARWVTQRPEGVQLITAALKAQVAELKRPGSVQLLSGIDT